MKICIQSNEDGTCSVYDEEKAQAQSTDPVGTDDLGAETAANVDEALELARSMLGADAGVDDKSPEALLAPPPEESMEAGYKKARGQVL